MRARFLGMGGVSPLEVFLSASWGSITGTLSAQTDLQSALDLKKTIFSNSESWVYGIAGLGSAASNKIIVFTTALLNTGTDITYTADATNGSNWKINTAGVYVMGCVIQTTSASRFCLTVNQSDLTVFRPNSIVVAEILSVTTGVQSITTETYAGAIGHFSVNDVIRVNVASTSSYSASDTCQFHIVRAY